MEHKKKTRAFPIVLSVVILLAVILPFLSYGQEVFSPLTPSQESLQNMPSTNKGPMRAGGGTGGGDPTNPGGGTDGNGNQNDTNAPISDALCFVSLLATGYAIYRKFKIKDYESSRIENGKLKMENECQFSTFN